MKKLIYTAAVLLLSACASSSSGSAGPAETLDIRVVNNIVPPVLLTISLVPSSGPERNLGEAFSSRATDFRYNGLAPRGQYRLLARAANNRAMASDYIVLDGVLALEWSLQTNRVTILRTKNDN
jgi:hypothetical protein